MFDDTSDFEALLGDITFGEKYIISPAEIGQKKDLFEELGDSERSYEEFRRMCYLHGSWEIQGTPAYFREKYGLSEEQECLFELLLENAIVHGNENDPNKTIEIKVLGGNHVAFKMTDQGRGFYPQYVLEAFQKGWPYSRGLGWGTEFAAKCTQSLVRYSRQGNSVKVLFLKGSALPKPYFTDIPR